MKMQASLRLIPFESTSEQVASMYGLGSFPIEAQTIFLIKG